MAQERSNSWRAWTRQAALLALSLALASVQAASVTYQRDARGRIVKASYDNGSIVEYLYDANGNRTGTAVTTPALPPPPDTTAPSAPGTPTFSNLTMTSVTASWTAASDDRSVTGYEYRLNAGPWQTLGSALAVNVTGLAAVMTYTFAVRARDAAANVGAASSASFTTPDTAAPSVPGGLSAAAPSSTLVTLSWSAASDNVAVSGYRIFRGGTQIGTSTATSYSDTGVSGSTGYAYRVSAYDAAGNQSAQSGAANVTTPDTIVPSVPGGLSAAAVSPTQVSLSWSGASDAGGSGLAGYRVYRNGAQIGSTAATSYSDTAAAPGTAYSYTVAAYDNASNLSAPSAAASLTTPVPLQATVSRTSWNWNRFAGSVSADAPIVITASGGSGGYTYSWSRISGDSATQVESPSSASTAWRRSNTCCYTDIVSVWQASVRDSSGTTVYTAQITVTFREERLD